jgi:hypothetical protein
VPGHIMVVLMRQVLWVMMVYDFMMKNDVIFGQTNNYYYIDIGFAVWA